MKTRRQGGVALIEFALSLPILLLLTLVVTEFGRAVYQYNLLTKTVRDAARYLSVQTPGTHVQEARNLMVYGNVAGTGQPLALGLSLSHAATPTWQTQGTGPVINTVTVRITGYSFVPLFPSVFGVNFGTGANGQGAIAFSNITATMRSPL